MPEHDNWHCRQPRNSHGTRAPGISRSTSSELSVVRRSGSSIWLRFRRPETHLRGDAVKLKSDRLLNSLVILGHEIVAGCHSSSDAAFAHIERPPSGGVYYTQNPRM